MNRIRIKRTYTMQLTGRSTEIFPLLCPVREYEWIEPWKCEMIYSNSGFAELECIFKTSFPEDGPVDTWVITRYEPPRLIEFIRVNSIRVIRYAITLIHEENDRSKWEWSQSISSTNAEGDAYVNMISEDVYIEEMKMIEKMLNHFLNTGKMLTID